MATTRTIRVTLTEQQFQALSAAVDDRSQGLLDNLEHGGADVRGQSRALGNGWEKIRQAWDAGSTPMRGIRHTDQPKCLTCGHAARSHNDLAYCTVGAGTDHACDCPGGYDSGWRRQR